MKFYLTEINVFTNTKVKKAPASSSHTCWENAGLSAQGEVGEMKQVLNKCSAVNFPPAFAALTSTVALKIPSWPVIKRATAGDRRIILCSGHLEDSWKPG